MEVRRRKVAVHSTFAVSQLPAAAIAAGPPRVGFRKPAFPISLAARNGLKNLPRQIISMCVCKVWWQSVHRCRHTWLLHTLTDTQTHRHTDTHTRMKLYVIHKYIYLYIYIYI